MFSGYDVSLPDSRAPLEDPRSNKGTEFPISQHPGMQHQFNFDWKDLVKVFTLELVIQTQPWARLSCLYGNSRFINPFPALELLTGIHLSPLPWGRNSLGILSFVSVFWEALKLA